MTSQILQKRSDLKRKLQDLYQELIEEGVLEDMELYHTDPIRMVSGEMAQFIKRLTEDPTMRVPASAKDENVETAVFASTVLAAAESLSQEDQERNRRLQEIKAPLQRSVDMLSRIIEDDEAVQVSKDALRQNVEILRQCLARLEDGT